jgi:hypothetical protein
LNQFGILLQNSQKKNRKEKEKRKGKRKKGRGKRFGLEPEPAHGPSPSLEAVHSPSLFLTDKWDPLVSTDISFNLRPRFSPGDSAITLSKSI